MLDVHPPHHSAHTWRDFCIHIATICVGLLIAIALEQTVEALHHRHQREYLEEQMHTECERNLQVIEPQIRFARGMQSYTGSVLRALDEAPRQGQGFLFTLPRDTAPTLGLLISPSRGTWTVATASGTVALLPAELAKVYARVDLVAAFEQAAESGLGNASDHWSTALRRAHVGLTPGTPTILTAQQRDDLTAAAAEFDTAIGDINFRLTVQQGSLQAVVAGARTLDEMYPYTDRALAASGAQASSARLAAASQGAPR